MSMFKRFAVALMVTLALRLSPVPAFANSTFDGTFSHVGRGSISYFSLIETGSEVAGFLYIVLADERSPAGVRETRVNVSGVTDGTRVNLREGQGTFSTTLGWVARSTYGGFIVSFPTNGGYLREAQYHRTSPAEVNDAISDIRHAADQQQQLQAAEEQRTPMQIWP